MKPITEKIYLRRNQVPFYPVITAHSGCEGTPDNSIEHIKTAIASGAECFEIDVNEHDGVLYLTHDKRAVYDGCVTLEECFRLAAEHPSICINCDVKDFGLTAAVTALAAHCGMENRILFTGSVRGDEIPALNETGSDWWLSLWHSDHEAEDIQKACETFRSLDNLYRIINLDNGMIHDSVIETVREAGYTLSAWTVNNEECMRRLMQSGVVANITTRKPLLALQIRKEIFGI